MNEPAYWSARVVVPGEDSVYAAEDVLSEREARDALVNALHARYGYGAVLWPNSGQVYHEHGPGGFRRGLGSTVDGVLSCNTRYEPDLLDYSKVP